MTFGSIFILFDYVIYHIIKLYVWTFAVYVKGLDPKNQHIKMNLCILITLSTIMSLFVKSLSYCQYKTAISQVKFYFINLNSYVENCATFIVRNAYD